MSFDQIKDETEHVFFYLRTVLEYLTLSDHKAYQKQGLKYLFLTEGYSRSKDRNISPKYFNVDTHTHHTQHSSD